MLLQMVPRSSEHILPREQEKAVAKQPEYETLGGFFQRSWRVDDKHFARTRAELD